MAWSDCQKYMRAIHDLRDELSRELDVVQTNGEPRIETTAALTRFHNARVEYFSSVMKENNDTAV